MRKQLSRRIRLRFVVLAVVPFVWILIAGCDVGVPPANQETNQETNLEAEPAHPFLKVVNAIAESKYIKSVALVGYEFANLYITDGSSQVFSLDKGMPGGYTNINVVVRYGLTTTTWTVQNTFDFSDGITTTVTLKDSNLE